MRLGSLLVVSGIVNIGLGLSLGPGLRVLRGQAPAAADLVAKEVAKQAKARNAWLRLRGLLANTISSNINAAAYAEMLGDMDAAIMKV